MLAFIWPGDELWHPGSDLPVPLWRCGAVWSAGTTTELLVIFGYQIITWCLRKAKMPKMSRINSRAGAEIVKAVFLFDGHMESALACDRQTQEGTGTGTELHLNTWGMLQIDILCERPGGKDPDDVDIQEDNDPSPHSPHSPELLWWTQPGQRSEPSLVTVIRAENDTWHRWFLYCWTHRSEYSWRWHDRHWWYDFDSNKVL